MRGEKACTLHTCHAMPACLPLSSLEDLGRKGHAYPCLRLRCHACCYATAKSSQRISLPAPATCIWGGRFLGRHAAETCLYMPCLPPPRRGSLLGPDRKKKKNEQRPFPLSTVTGVEDLCWRKEEEGTKRKKRHFPCHPSMGTKQASRLWAFHFPGEAGEEAATSPCIQASHQRRRRKGLMSINQALSSGIIDRLLPAQAPPRFGKGGGKEGAPSLTCLTCLPNTHVTKCPLPNMHAFPPVLHTSLPMGPKGKHDTGTVWLWSWRWSDLSKPLCTSLPQCPGREDIAHCRLPGCADRPDPPGGGLHASFHGTSQHTHTATIPPPLPALPYHPTWSMAF